MNNQTVFQNPIVRDFMSKNVVTARADSHVSDAIRLMVQRNIGSIVVEDKSGPLGVFTERDLISKVLGPKKTLKGQTLMDITLRTLNTIDGSESLGDAARQMISKKGRLLVFEEDELVGIVTASDIVRAIYANEERFYIDDFIRKKVVTVNPELSVQSVIEIMDQKGIGSVLVNYGDQLGIFTERDMLKMLLLAGKSRDLSVEGFATRPIITGPLGLGGYEVAEIMVKNRIKRLPLMEGSKIAGIITARDLVGSSATRL